MTAFRQHSRLGSTVLSIVVALILVFAFHWFELVPTDQSTQPIQPAQPAQPAQPDKDQRVTDVVSAVYAAFGVVYGVLLAQVVLASWSDREDAKTAVFREADALSDLVRLSSGFVEDHKREIQQAVEKYADAVISGWSEQTSDRDGHQAGEEELLTLVSIYAHARPERVDSDAFLSASLDQLDALGDARGDRLMASRSSLPDTLWAVLIFQGVLIVGFSAVFFNVSADSIGAHVGLVLVLALVMFLFAGLVWCLDHPFSCWPAIDPYDLQRSKMLARRMHCGVP